MSDTFISVMPAWKSCALFLATLAFCCACRHKPPEQPATYEISFAQLQDKIKGGWAGQMIGVSYGAPTEFRYRGEVIPEEHLPAWDPQMIRNSLNQDDIYVDVTFAEVLDKVGLDATTEDFAEMFKNSRYRLWHANLAARRALRRGVSPHESGHPKYNIHANDIDFQIEADFIGLMAPAMPQAAIEYAQRVGRIMNYGDGIYGGIFISCMYSAAFFESDPRRIVQAGLACLPQQSQYAQVVSDVLQWSQLHPDNWIEVWRLVQQKWDKNDPCPSGALTPFNIDAKLNGAYVALGLLFGKGDFTRTLQVATRCGQDSDCNPASAAGILGVVLGYSGIPDIYKRAIPEIQDEKFAFTNHSFRSIVERTVQRAIDLAQRQGGKFLGDRLVIPAQQPSPPPLQAWNDYGVPVERIPIGDDRWSWKGPWTTYREPDGKPYPDMRRAYVKGAEATVQFTGSGFILVGAYLPTGGTADIYLDNQPPVTVDAFLDDDSPRLQESLFHRFNLPPGQHTLRLVVRGEPYPGSKGQDIVLRDLIVFAPQPHP